MTVCFQTPLSHRYFDGTVTFSQPYIMFRRMHYLCLIEIVNGVLTLEWVLAVKVIVSSMSFYLSFLIRMISDHPIHKILIFWLCEKFMMEWYTNNFWSPCSQNVSRLTMWKVYGGTAICRIKAFWTFPRGWLLHRVFTLL